MRNRRLIGVLLTLPSCLGFGTQAFAQAAPPISAAETAISPASTPTPSSTSTINFSAGACALFVWSGYPLRLMYISQAGTREAYSAQDGLKRYGVNPQGGPDKFEQYAAQDLLDGVNTPAQLRLDSPVEFYKSAAYSSGTLTLPGPDGWLSIETAKAVSTCNDTNDDRSIRFNAAANRFDVPAWLETPTRLEMLQPPPSPPAPSQAAPEIILNAEVSPIPQPQIGEAPEVKEIPAPLQTTLVSYQREITPQIAPLEQNAVPAPVISTDPILTIIPDPAAEVPTGYMVQIGAFPSEAIARQKWDDFQYDIDFLEQSQSIVQVAAVEDIGVVYRLRITGLPNRKQALTFCQRLKSTGVDCFVPRD